MKYKCLVLDHDDTSVKSTAMIHHPAHVETVLKLRPELAPLDLDSWLLKNFHPGVMEYFTGELGFSSEEIEEEYRIWRRYNDSCIPDFFEGFIDFLALFRRSGGITAVVSHSEADVIKKHYEAEGSGFMPDMIFGWDYDPAKRKPSPWPVEQIISKFDLSPGDMLMVDDLKPGVDMARKTGIDIAAAGWGHSIAQIRQYMEANCNYYLESIEDLKNLLEI